MKLCKFLYVTAGMIFSFCFEKVCECYAIEMNTEEKIGLQASEEKITIRCFFPGLSLLVISIPKSKEIFSIMNFANNRASMEDKPKYKHCVYNGTILSLKNTLDHYQIKNLDALFFFTEDVSDDLLRRFPNKERIENFIAHITSKDAKIFDDVKEKKLEIKPAKYINKIHREMQLMCNQDTPEHHETIISENIDNPSTDPLPMPW